MNWRVKGVVQKVLAAMPGGVRVNDALQGCVGGLRDFRSQVESKVVGDWAVFATYFQEIGVPLAGLRYLEVGTGWFPTLPVCFSLAGAREVVTFDQVRHLDRRNTFRMVNLLGAHLPAIAAAGGRSLADVEADYTALKGAKHVEELCREARVVYHAPADAAATGLPDGSVDVVFSNSVLEHVPPDAITRIMRETYRVLRRGGHAVHGVNCGDHYAYFDRKITPINYLSYTEREWGFWNNRLLYQNRLRPVDFLRAAEGSGLDVVLSRSRPREKLLSVLPQMGIAPEFQDYPPEELCCTSVDFVARKP